MEAWFKIYWRVSNSPPNGISQSECPNLPATYEGSGSCYNFPILVWQQEKPQQLEEAPIV